MFFKPAPLKAAPSAPAVERTRRAVEPVFEPEIPVPEPPKPNISAYVPQPALKNIAFKEKTGFSGGPSPEVIVEAPWTLLANVVDMLVLTSINLVMMLIVMTTTGIDPLLKLSQSRWNSEISLAVMVMVVTLMGMYFTASRVFAHQTLGEWVFDLTMGHPKQFRRASYMWRVLARCLIVLGTGIVLLPLLSFFSRRDLTGRAVGLRLHRQRK